MKRRVEGRALGRWRSAGHSWGSLVVLGAFGGAVTVALSFHLAGALGSRARAEHLAPSLEVLSEVSAVDRAWHAGDEAGEADASSGE